MSQNVTLPSEPPYEHANSVSLDTLPESTQDPSSLSSAVFPDMVITLMLRVVLLVVHAPPGSIKFDMVLNSSTTRRGSPIPSRNRSTVLHETSSGVSDPALYSSVRTTAFLKSDGKQSTASDLLNSREQRTCGRLSLDHAWLKGRTSVSGQRSFAVPRSTCS